MHSHSIAFLQADIENRRRLVDDHLLNSKAELNAALDLLKQEQPKKDQSLYYVLGQHAEQAKHSAALAAAECESLADLINSLRRCDC